MTQVKAELLDYMGTDLDVVNAAKVSFSKESEWEWQTEYECGVPVSDTPILADKDKKLINYLATHDHWTPFAHTALKFRCSAPVPIRTQAFKHKIGMVENEESRRYISSTPEIYIPEFFRAKPEGSIKQGSGGEHNYSREYRQRYEAHTQLAVRFYEEMLEVGICPEQARFVLPQGAIVNWIWTGNLVSFANFYNKRTDTNAQYEVRLLAESVGKQIAEIFPVSWKALVGG